MNCPIHLETVELDKEAIVALPCGHVFCHPCITKCLEAVKPRKICQCPLCKKPATQKTILRLFLQPRSPTSSPTKSQTTGHLSPAEKSRAQALRQELEDLDNNGSEERIAQACADMNHFSESVTGTSMDIETKCLAEEIKAAANRFQTLILPELQDLKSIRARASDLEEENAQLKSTLRQREKEISANHRRRTALDNEMEGLRRSKKVADDKASSLRETLSVTSEKLVDALNTVRTRDDALQEKSQRLAQFKAWLADHKSKAEKMTRKIRDLEKRLDEQSSRSSFSSEHPQEEPCTGSSSVRMEGGILDIHIDTPNDSDSRPPAKRRRTGLKKSVEDVKIDTSCFLKKPEPSFKIPMMKLPTMPKQRIAGPSLAGLNIKAGQVKGPVILGSRQRLGKLG